jgi:hypothetical protein
MLLTLAQASPDVVSLDYILSRIGTEPVRSMLLAFAMDGTKAQSQEEPGFYNLASLRVACWNAFIGAMQREYGGFEQFIISKLGFSEEDLAKIKNNLTA